MMAFKETAETICAYAAVGLGVAAAAKLIYDHAKPYFQRRAKNPLDTPELRESGERISQLKRDLGIGTPETPRR